MIELKFLSDGEKTYLNNDHGVTKEINLSFVEKPAFVTPEMFGAIGDGVTDDTAAWQTAVDSGFSVKASKTRYKCGKININKDIIVDCCGASFIATDSILFNCSGSVVATLTGEGDYTPNEVGYLISNENYTSYSGFAMLKGTNNFEPSRDYYKGGFVCEFENGKMNGSYPIGVTGVSIEIINPVTVRIKNIGDILNTAGAVGGQTIKLTHCVNSTVSNVKAKNAANYSFIGFNSCMNCVAESIFVNQYFQVANNNSYIIEICDSVKCDVKNSVLHNRMWHCWSSGGVYLCYDNKIESCLCTGNNQYAVLDHNNARRTSVLNSVIAGVWLNGLSVIDNTSIIPLDNASKTCLLTLSPCAEQKNACYTVKNVTFCTDGDSAASNVRVYLRHDTGTTGGSYYYKHIEIHNLITTGVTKNTIQLALTSGNTYTLGEIFIKNTDADILIDKSSTDTFIDMSNYILTLSDIIEKNPTGNRCTIGSGNDKVMNVVHFRNCNVRQIRGVYTEVYLDEVECNDYSKMSVSGKLIGGTVIGNITDSVLAVPTSLAIAMMTINNNYKYFNIVNDNNGKKWRSAYVSGVVNVTEITA